MNMMWRPKVTAPVNPRWTSFGLVLSGPPRPLCRFLIQSSILAMKRGRTTFHRRQVLSGISRRPPPDRGRNERDGSASGRRPRWMDPENPDQPDFLRQLHLRGRQSHGARFAVVQRRIILGDDSGLGKRSRLLLSSCISPRRDINPERNLGRSVVVSAASVIVNWLSEL